MVILIRCNAMHWSPRCKPAELLGMNQARVTPDHREYVLRHGDIWGLWEYIGFSRNAMGISGSIVENQHGNKAEATASATTNARLGAFKSCRWLKRFSANFQRPDLLQLRQQPLLLKNLHPALRDTSTLSFCNASSASTLNPKP